MTVHIFAVLAVQLRSLLCFFHVEVGQLLLDKARLRIIAHALPAVKVVRRLRILREPLLLRQLLSIRPLLLGRNNDSILTSIYQWGGEQLRCTFTCRHVWKLRLLNS